jgi:hypothetical protein
MHSCGNTATKRLKLARLLGQHGEGFLTCASAWTAAPCAATSSGAMLMCGSLPPKNSRSSSRTFGARCVRKASGWPKECKLAHAFQWGYMQKRLGLAQLLGQLARHCREKGVRLAQKMCKLAHTLLWERGHTRPYTATRGWARAPSGRGWCRRRVRPRPARPSPRLPRPGPGPPP